MENMRAIAYPKVHKQLSSDASPHLPARNSDVPASSSAAGHQTAAATLSQPAVVTDAPHLVDSHAEAGLCS